MVVSANLRRTGQAPMSGPASDRIQTLREFFSDAGYVCPFAKWAPRLVDAGDGQAPLEGVLVQWTAVWAQHPALVLVSETTAQEEGAFRAKMRDLMQRCWKAALWLGTTLAPQQIGQLAARAVAETFDPRCPRRPFISLRNEPLSMVALGCLYGPQHTRYAPCDCLVLTRVKDVSGVAPEAVVRIRERVSARMGTLYDADEPVLPMRTRPTTL